MKPIHFLKRMGLVVLCLILCLVCIGGTLHFLLFDGLEDFILSLFLEDTTVYSPGYSEQVFRTIHTGMHEREVLTMLGRPLSEGWYYYSTENERLYGIHFDTEELVLISDEGTPVQRGMTKNQVNAFLGEPSQKAWAYSSSPTSGSYWLRVILFKEKTVTKINHKFYVD